jgi:CRISPR-associated protein Cmr5
MPVTYEQKLAQKAFACVNRPDRRENKEYISFAKSFPSLVHSCGLVQAVAFARMKNSAYLDDLTAVLQEIENGIDLPARSRDTEVVEYMRLSRWALSAASWLKRCAQAFE